MIARTLRAWLVTVAILGMASAVAPSAHGWNVIMEMATQDSMRGTFSNAFHEFSTECARCAAFYGLTAEALRGDPREGTEELVTANERLYELLVAAGSALVDNEKVMEARLTLWGRQMLEDIDGTWNNFEILFVKHADFCKSLVEDPHARMVTLIAEIE